MKALISAYLNNIDCEIDYNVFFEIFFQTTIFNIYYKASKIINYEL